MQLPYSFRPGQSDGPGRCIAWCTLRRWNGPVEPRKKLEKPRKIMGKLDRFMGKSMKILRENHRTTSTLWLFNIAMV